MVYCCVPNCGSEKGKTAGVSFHEFPSTNEELKQCWIYNIARRHPVSGEMWMPNQRSSVCSKHFTEDDFKQGARRRCLNKDAAPTVFPSYPSAVPLQEASEMPEVDFLEPSAEGNSEVIVVPIRKKRKPAANCTMRIELLFCEEQGAEPEVMLQEVEVQEEVPPVSKRAPKKAHRLKGVIEKLNANLDKNLEVTIATENIPEV